MTRHERRNWVLFAISAGSVASLVPLLWLMQSHVSDPDPSDLNHWWLVFGFSAQALFAGRLIVQWVASEKLRRSVVPTSFWWLSLLGGLMLLVYFWRRSDPVGIAGQLFGNVVYVRNLYFLYAERRRVRVGASSSSEAREELTVASPTQQEMDARPAEAGFEPRVEPASLPQPTTNPLGQPPPRQRPSAEPGPVSARSRSLRQDQSRQRQ